MNDKSPFTSEYVKPNSISSDDNVTIASTEKPQKIKDSLDEIDDHIKKIYSLSKPERRIITAKVI